MPTPHWKQTFGMHQWSFGPLRVMNITLSQGKVHIVTVDHSHGDLQANLLCVTDDSINISYLLRVSTSYRNFQAWISTLKTNLKHREFIFLLKVSIDYSQLWIHPFFWSLSNYSFTFEERPHSNVNGHLAVQHWMSYACFPKHYRFLLDTNNLAIGSIFIRKLEILTYLFTTLDSDKSGLQEDKQKRKVTGEYEEIFLANSVCVHVAKLRVNWYTFVFHEKHKRWELTSGIMATIQMILLA